MHTELAILRALLRLSRRRAVADLDTLLVRVGGTEAELVVGLRALEAAGFVYGKASHIKLTMAGLAVAVAQIAPIGDRKKAADARTKARGTARRATPKRRAA